MRNPFGIRADSARLYTLRHATPLHLHVMSSGSTKSKTSSDVTRETPTLGLGGEH